MLDVASRRGLRQKSAVSPQPCRARNRGAGLEETDDGGNRVGGGARPDGDTFPGWEAL